VKWSVLKGQSPTFTAGRILLKCHSDPSHRDGGVREHRAHGEGRCREERPSISSTKEASSADCAGFLKTELDRGRAGLWFAIGGAEGLDAALRERAAVTYSFGRMALPHQFVRILAAEQIYRALTILSGHPYHWE
jgi:Predicted SPOUT methyltransferase